MDELTPPVLADDVLHDDIETRLIEPLHEPTPRQRTSAPKLADPTRLDEFQRIEFPLRENLLAPWLPDKGLAMVYGPRGIGKTFLTLSIACAVASGGELLGWKAPSPRRVLLLDGEMPAASLQERFKLIAPAYPGCETNIDLLLSDLLEFGLPDLGSVHGQDELQPKLSKADLIIVDNISTLCRTGIENEAQGWVPVQNWALAQRRSGKTVLFIHHAGKNGRQRGSSKREDVLDAVLALQRPEDYQASDGARFDVHFDKCRGFMGDEAKPFGAMLSENEGGFCWSRSEIRDELRTEVLALRAEGHSVRAIASQLDISKSSVQRTIKP